jgi:hypothetical protein
MPEFMWGNELSEATMPAMLVQGCCEEGKAEETEKGVCSMVICDCYMLH